MRKLVKKKKRNQFNALHYNRVTGHFRYFFSSIHMFLKKFPAPISPPPLKKNPKILSEINAAL